jgi:hypothetical protein
MPYYPLVRIILDKPSLPHPLTFFSLFFCDSTR